MGRVAMTILVTGFEPLEGELNASKILVESLRDDPPLGLSNIPIEIHFAIMPLSTERVRSNLLDLISRLKPAFCVFTGQAPGRNRITFERLATNLRDFSTPDGEGRQPRGEPIEADGPAAYWSSLPDQEPLIRRLNDNGIPAAFSNHAGNYLCNQILYHGLHNARTKGGSMACGFIHIPPLPVQAQKQYVDTPFIPLAMARDALVLILGGLSARLTGAVQHLDS